MSTSHRLYHRYPTDSGMQSVSPQGDTVRESIVRICGLHNGNQLVLSANNKGMVHSLACRDFGFDYTAGVKGLLLNIRQMPLLWVAGVLGIYASNPIHLLSIGYES